jgi:GNAT superfamily N-acetyltransferase
MTIEYKPLTMSTWKDFEVLFGPRGACGGCWCMWWRLTSSEFDRRKGTGNKRSMKRIVRSGDAPGIIGYREGEPIAWCSVAPRESFPRLERSRVLRRIDGQPAWSVVCFYISKRYRRKGISGDMLEAAVRFASTRGARIIEGYPVEPRSGETADVFAHTGLASTFRDAGFREVARRSETRPIMRLCAGAEGGPRTAAKGSVL